LRPWSTEYGLVCCLLLLVGLSACATTGPAREAGPQPTDPQATRQTRALFHHLQTRTSGRILLGHQDDTAYGVHWWREPGGSDVKAVTGAYPAVYGWDLSKYEHPDALRNIDSVSFADMRRWMIEAYRRGGVITVSWHLDNPVSGGNSWDTTRAVAHILPGGTHHAVYTAWLDRVAAFLKSLRTGRWAWLGRGHAVPVVFRPFHEHTGSWFWWGRAHCTPEEYRALWQFTVAYLRDRKGVHNLLYAYAPNALSDYPRTQYFERYPGDAYVDVLGLDDYYTLQRPSGAAVFSEQLGWLVQQARSRGKIPALTEIGLEGVKDSTWFTGKLLPSFTTDPNAHGIAWVLLWRNAPARDKPGHFFAPYPGHPAAGDFHRFRQHPLIGFEDDLPDLYRMPDRRQ
jgi:mannan endo-1,4-beta-mannosidase